MRIGYIGYGEAAYAMSCGIADEKTGVEQYACSRSFSYRGKPEDAGVKRCSSYEELSSVCDMIFVMTPNVAALATAEKVAPFLREGMLYVDLTSSAPKLMQQAAELVERSGAHFVDAAMLDRLTKFRNKVKIVVSGSGADEFMAHTEEFGMCVEKIGNKPGEASAIKMLRSLYTKAHLAFALEMLEGAASYGVEDYVMKSLAETMDCKDFVSGMDDRTCGGIFHAARRADELEMAANMLDDAGVYSGTSHAAAEKLREIGRLNLKEKLNGECPTTWKGAVQAIIKYRSEQQ